MQCLLQFDYRQTVRWRMLFHLEAASAHAEELQDARALELIDSTRKVIERQPDPPRQKK